MTPLRRAVAVLFALSLALGVGAGCGDDPGEDEIGDGEINDEGD